MKDFKGKIVFISGGASGAGLGQAKVFGREGMKVAIGDVREDALENAKKELIAFGIPEKDILAIKVDLTDRSVAISGIGFGMGDMAPTIQNGNPVDVCYSLEENTYNGVTSIQMKVEDIVPTESTEK